MRVIRVMKNRCIRLGGTALVIGGLLCSCGTGSSSSLVTLNFLIGNENSGSYANAVRTCNQEAKGEYHIVWQVLPSSADDQRQQLVLRSAAADHSLDILGLDVTWTAEFADAKWILPWPAPLAARVRRGTLSGPLRTATWHARLYGAPFNSNTQLLWYRKSLVPNPPTTWQQMLADASQLAEEGKPHYVEEQGAPYEGLTVWFNSLVNSAGGTILSPNGRAVTLGPSAKLAAQTMKDLASGPAGDPSLSVTMEDQARLAFQSGTAAFEINYPFVYPAAKEGAPGIYKDMGWAPFPSLVPGRPGKSSIGGYNLAVSAYSLHPQQAFTAAACLRSAQNQIVDAIKGGLPPTLASLYQNPEVRAEYPFADIILEQLENPGIRPITPAYENVTRYIQAALSPPADINPTTSISSLRGNLERALKSEGVLP
jgi:multiple sugar transport system substrate-binding protein